jgi:NAD+ kinase
MSQSTNNEVASSHDLTESQEENLLPEHIKTRPRLIVSKDELEEIQKNRKIKLSDLVKIPQRTESAATALESIPTFEWPYELVLVRHGQSEGNEAVARSQRGDLSAYTPEFKRKHSSTYRLTDKGIAQAKVAGKYIKEYIGEKFDRYYTSEYVRAMETAALLDLPGARWYTEIVLRERDKGPLDNTSVIERNEKWAEEMERRKRDSFFWAPPGGESLANVCVRVDHTFNTLRRDCSRQRVIVVCHGEVMWAFRVRLERLSQMRFHKLYKSKNPKDRIHNTTILHYTRIHPKTGEIFPYFRFMRSICPWKPEYSR